MRIDRGRDDRKGEKEGGRENRRGEIQMRRGEIQMTTEGETTEGEKEGRQEMGDG